MASKPKDWTGQKFGRLTAVRSTGRKINGNLVWEYLCDCGKTVELKSGNVVFGHTTSCGCYALESKTKHGHSTGNSKSPTLSVWSKMMSRAFWRYEEYSEYYSDVSVCEEWSDKEFGFSNFLRDMGEKPEGMSLNRKRGAKEYSKDNCEWATPTQQAYDRRKLKKNVSGRTGVKFRQDRGKWEARIGVEGQKLLLYYGDSFEEACAAREEAELKYYGFTKE